jgi:UDP-2,3-diacylglucosamine pyrophosphatase LpxH
MSDFHMDRRFYMLFGNHNRAWQNPKTVKQQLTTYQDEATLEDVALFPGITVYEALILHHQESNHQLFITHGHQGDLLSDVLWPVSRFFVRVVWRTCQILGRRDPTSPAQNYRKRQRVEHRLIAWVIRHQRALICGHTHRPTFPQADAPPYYNTGSCVHPYAITGLEIVDSTLRLIKWEMRSDPDGVMRIVRETLGGPRPIEDL